MPEVPETDAAADTGTFSETFMKAWDEQKKTKGSLKQEIVHGLNRSVWLLVLVLFLQKFSIWWQKDKGGLAESSPMKSATESVLTDDVVDDDLPEL